MGGVQASDAPRIQAGAATGQAGGASVLPQPPPVTEGAPH